MSEYLKEHGYIQKSMRCFVKKDLVKTSLVKDRNYKRQESLKLSCGFERALAIGCGGRTYIDELHMCTPYRRTIGECKEEIGIQTNLSFDIPSLINIINDMDGRKDKIRLWCSYHPSMVTEEGFLKQCDQLTQNNMIYSVGSVGVPKKIDKYKLLKIDPLFINELNYNRKNLNTCAAGIKSIFIEANGDYYPCHINNKRLGNIYTENNDTLISKDIVDHIKYEKYTRTIEKHKLDAVFIDLDGTLLDQRGDISTQNQIAIESMSETMDIYINSKNL